MKIKKRLTTPTIVESSHADLPVNRPRYVIGTSHVNKSIHWEWEFAPAVSAAVAALDEDLSDETESAVLNQQSLEEPTPFDSFDLFYIAAAAKGFRDRGHGLGVIGDHISAFLQRCAAAMEELLIRVQELENQSKRR